MRQSILWSRYLVASTFCADGWNEAGRALSFPRGPWVGMNVLRRRCLDRLRLLLQICDPWRLPRVCASGRAESGRAEFHGEQGPSEDCACTGQAARWRASWQRILPSSSSTIQCLRTAAFWRSMVGCLMAVGCFDASKNFLTLYSSLPQPLSLPVSDVRAHGSMAVFNSTCAETLPMNNAWKNVLHLQ